MEIHFLTKIIDIMLPLKINIFIYCRSISYIANQYTCFEDLKNKLKMILLKINILILKINILVIKINIPFFLNRYACIEDQYFDIEEQ